MGHVVVLDIGGGAVTHVVDALAGLGAETQLVGPVPPGQGLTATTELLVAPDGLGDGTRAWLEACMGSRTSCIEGGHRPGDLRWALERLDTTARTSGTSVVLGAGLSGGIGSLLAALAVDAVGDADEVHVAYAFPGVLGLLSTLTDPDRRRAMLLLSEPNDALVDGRRRPEIAGEVRRLAWFPRPVGPRHAAGIPGFEPQTIPRVFPPVRSVRTYLALPSLQAELLQLVAAWSGRTSVGRAIDRALARVWSPSDERRRRTRWGCVAEAHRHQEIARAWAYGRDPYAVSAALLMAVARRMLEGSVPPGVTTPVEVLPAREALDQLSAATGLRWSRTRPRTP